MRQGSTNMVKSTVSSCACISVQASMGNGDGVCVCVCVYVRGRGAGLVFMWGTAAAAMTLQHLILFAALCSLCFVDTKFDIVWLVSLELHNCRLLTGCRAGYAWQCPEGCNGKTCSAGHSLHSVPTASGETPRLASAIYGWPVKA